MRTTNPRTLWSASLDHSKRAQPFRVAGAERQRCPGSTLRAPARSTGASDYRRALAAIYLAWLDFVSRDPKVKLENQLPLIERGLYHDPANVALLNRLLAHVKV